jgi:hypothetical protein
VLRAVAQHLPAARVEQALPVSAHDLHRGVVWCEIPHGGRGRSWPGAQVLPAPLRATHAHRHLRRSVGCAAGHPCWLFTRLMACAGEAPCLQQPTVQVKRPRFGSA